MSSTIIGIITGVLAMVLYEIINHFLTPKIKGLKRFALMFIITLSVFILVIVLIKPLLSPYL